LSHPEVSCRYGYPAQARHRAGLTQA